MLSAWFLLEMLLRSLHVSFEGQQRSLMLAPGLSLQELAKVIILEEDLLDPKFQLHPAVGLWSVQHSWVVPVMAIAVFSEKYEM
jgi:hypothetical protein